MKEIDEGTGDDLMGNVLIERDTMVDIADSIRGKTGGVELMKPDEMPGAIDSIPGKSVADREKAIRFFSYDGELLYSFTLEELDELEDLPPVPEVQGLVSQGWNWTLAELRYNGDMVDVGPMYITDDGATRIYIKLEGSRLSPVLGFMQSAENGVAVDWGDGSPTERSQVSGNTRVNLGHTYPAAGSYVISLLPDEGTTITIGGKSYTGGQYASDLLYMSTDNVAEHRIYSDAVRKIEMGRNVDFRSYAFAGLMRMISITTPEWGSMSDYAFVGCTSLRMYTMPKGFIMMNGNAFSSCTSLRQIAIPSSMVMLQSEAFDGCASLERMSHIRWNQCPMSTFAGCRSLTSVHLVNKLGIPADEFSGAGALREVTFENTENMMSIGKNAFLNCSSLETIVIPAEVGRIYMAAFKNTGLKSVYVCPETPPYLDDATVFENTPSDMVIYVPHGCLAAYSAASYWSTYADRMVEMPE